jgi:hypothetical protein
MIGLVRHFKANGSVGAVCDDNRSDAGDLHVSRNLARKIRNRVNDGMLDWVLEEAGVGILESPVEHKSNAPGLDAQLYVADQMRHQQALRDFTKEIEGSLEIDLAQMFGLASRSPSLKEHPLYVDLRERLVGHKIWSIFEQWDGAIASVEAKAKTLLERTSKKVRDTGIPMLRWKTVIMADDRPSPPTGLFGGFASTVVLNAILDTQQGKWIEYPYLWQDNASLEVTVQASATRGFGKPFHREFEPFNMPDAYYSVRYFWCAMHWASSDLKIRIAVGKGPDLARFRRLHMDLRKQLHDSKPVLELLGRLGECAPIRDLLVKQLIAIRHMDSFH